MDVARDSQHALLQQPLMEIDMTKAQMLSFYFPAWRRCAAALGWVMVEGRIKADLVEQSAMLLPEPAGTAMRDVIQSAGKLADAAGRPVNSEDLRHACNLVATGEESSKRLTNAHTNRVVALFRLLAAPEDLTAITEWLHPENAVRRGYIASIRKRAPEAYAQRVAAGKSGFASKHYEDLPLTQLRNLTMTIVNRSRRRLMQPAPECPF